jgi:predicted secreted protein
LHYSRQLIAIVLMSLLALPGHANEKNTYNRVSFQVTEQREVNNNEITVTMGIEHDSRDATSLADEMNQLIASAITTIKKFPSIKSSTSDYSIRPIYSRDRHLDHWRGASSIVLKSQNSKDMAAVVQKLQETMLIKTTGFSVSADRREKIQTEMIDSALKKFNARAKQVSNNMGFKKYRLVNININTSGNTPRPVYANAMASPKAMSAEIAAPSFESGYTTLNVIVSGTIEMEVTP